MFPYDVILMTLIGSTVVGLILVCAMGSFRKIDLRYVQELHGSAREYADARVEIIKEEFEGHAKWLALEFDRIEHQIRKLRDKTGRYDASFIHEADTEGGDKETETEEGQPMQLKIANWTMDDLIEAVEGHAERMGMVPPGYVTGEITIEILDSDGEEVDYDEINITLSLNPPEKTTGA
jgi:hypothetical protein